MWLKDGRLCCDTCPKTLDYPGPRVLVIEAARAHGWHCFRGQSITGKDMDSVICDDCTGSPRAKLPPRKPMDEDVTLFDLS